MNKYLFFDLETTGLSEFNDRIHGIAVLINEDEPQYFPSWEVPQWVRDQLADPTITKVYHSTDRFDPRFLVQAGYVIAGPLFSTHTMAQQVDENQPLGLKPLSEKYLGPNSLKSKRKLDEAMRKAGVTNLAAFCQRDLEDPQHPHFPTIAEYGVEDVCNMFKLFHVFKKRLKDIHASVTVKLNRKTSPLTYLLKEIVPTESVLLAMEIRGVRINTAMIEELRVGAVAQRDKYLEEMRELCREEIQVIEERLYQKVLATKVTSEAKAKVQRGNAKQKTKFNFESGRHVGTLVYEHLNLPPPLIKRTAKGQYMTSETYLKFLQSSFLKGSKGQRLLAIYAKYKKTLKIIGTYTGTEEKGILSKVIYHGGVPYIHARYPQITSMGRLSSKEPNLQNLPRDSYVKKFFIPDTTDHVFVYLDYSQLQLRCAAHLSQDEKLIFAYQTDKDLHKQTAARMFRVEESAIGKESRERQSGKTANFAIIFDCSPYQLIREFKDKNGLDYTLDECKAFREAWFEEFKDYRAYLDRELSLARRRRFVIGETGRVRRLPDLVYGDYLDWNGQKFTGPRELREKLLNHPNETPDDRELFMRAKGRSRHAKNQAFCMPIQNLESVIVKAAMVELHKRGFCIKSQIHDALIIQLHKSELHKVAEIKDVMENTYKISVPLKAEPKLLTTFHESDKYRPEPEKNLA